MPLEFKSSKFLAVDPSRAETKAADTGELSILGASFLNLDRGHEIIMPGAYSKHLEYFSKNGKVLADHTYSVRAIAAKVFRAYEMKQGLVIDSKFTGDEIGKWARERAREGSIDTTSIGHYVHAEKTGLQEQDVRKIWDEYEYTPTAYDLKMLSYSLPVRLITEAEPVEVSFVVVPMNPESRVLEVKSIMRDIESKKGSVLNRVNRKAMVSIYQLAKSILKSAKLEIDEQQDAAGQSEPTDKAACVFPEKSKSRKDLLKLKCKLIELDIQLRRSL